MLESNEAGNISRYTNHALIKPETIHTEVDIGDESYCTIGRNKQNIVPHSSTLLDWQSTKSNAN